MNFDREAVVDRAAIADRPFHRKEAMRLAQELKAARCPEPSMFREWAEHMRALLVPAKPDNTLREIYQRMYELERRMGA